MNNKIIYLILPLIILLLAIFSYVNRPEELRQQPAGELQVEQQPTEDAGQDDAIPSLTFEATEDGQTAFELLQENAEVGYQESNLGIYVTSINGVEGGSDYYWAMYVNGEYGTMGIAETELQAGDIVEFKYEEIIY